MRAVVYGGGNIGRGFIGQLFFESGYDTAFIDVNEEMINLINKDKCYPVRILEGNGYKDFIVKNVSGINGNDIESVKNAIAEADICATSVGVNILKFIAKPLREGLKKRFSIGNLKPLNIIICENKIGADKLLRELIEQEMNDEEKKYMKNIGFVEASIGRMVPVQTSEMKDGNPLRICVEKYSELPVDKEAFKGEIPQIKNMLPASNFDFYIKRKLFVHNMGHAITAYLGNLDGNEYIWQAIKKPYIEFAVLRAMNEVAMALSIEFDYRYEKLNFLIEDLIYRFNNVQLADTVERVGKDLNRKLSPNDRLVGAYKLCEVMEIDNTYISLGIAAALLFQYDELSKEDPKKVLSEICELNEKQIDGIMELYNLLKNKVPLSNILFFIKEKLYA